MDSTEAGVTESMTRCSDVVNKEEVTIGEQDEVDVPLQKVQEHGVSMGDHLYQWRSFAGIPGMFQHHGIVLRVEGDQVIMADCNAMLLRGNVVAATGDEEPTLVLTIHPDGRLATDARATPWHQVQYQASWWRRHLFRSGTCTAVPSDPPGLVLARVQFLLQNPNTLPKHHFLKANCECVAVWCKTGTWATLQASSFLHVTAAGQIKSATTLALMASSQQVTVPAAGLWGYLGFTTKVSLISTQPFLLPAIAGYGLVSVGGPVWMLHRAKRDWSHTTERLHDEFWRNAIDRPEVFVECITEWSELE